MRLTKEWLLLCVMLSVIGKMLIISKQRTTRIVFRYAKRSLGTSVRLDFRSLPIKRIRHEISANENDLHKNRDRFTFNV